MEYKRLLNAIDEILWNDWDPIGINHVKEIRNEYSGYVHSISILKINGEDRETIAQELYKIETERMALNGRIDHCRAVADKIIALK